MTFKCPRCGATVQAGEPDASGFFTCGSCGARLRAGSPSRGPASPGELQTLAGELRDLKRLVGEVLQLQAQILTALKARPDVAAQREDEPDLAGQEQPSHDDRPAPVPRVRRRRKSVVIVDDDPGTLQAALAALEQAQVPVRSAHDGNVGLALMAEDKPDVLVLELDLGEPMPGKDLVNMVKATMEWVDIPIVLYTRADVKSQQEARVEHGADEVVLKGPGAPEALLNRVIRIFQGR